MMQEITINGKGLWSVFRCRVAKGTYEKLLTPAPMKAYITNENRLEHGKKIMTENSRTDSREISIQVFVEGDTEDEYLTNYQSFLNELQTGKLILSVPRLRTIFSFVYTGGGSYGDYGLKRGKFTLKLIEPSISNRQTIKG